MTRDDLSSDIPSIVFRDFAKHTKTFEKAIELFSSASEDVRRSAAFAAGNIAVGNPGAFLPSILQLIQADDKKRYLALQALKEVSLRFVSKISRLVTYLISEIDYHQQFTSSTRYYFR